MVHVLLMGALTAFGGIDIYGAHTTHVRGGCTGDYGKTCALIVPEWTPNANGRGSKLPFESAGRITRIKLPLSGPSTIVLRVVRATGKDTFRVRRSSPPLRIRRAGWLKARLNLSYRKGDTIAIGIRGTEGPHIVHGGMEPSPNGSGDVLLAADYGASWIRHANGLPGDGDDSLSSQGVSMILTTRAARR